jgi:hypothetical protein
MPMIKPMRPMINRKRSAFFMLLSLGARGENEESPVAGLPLEAGRPVCDWPGPSIG